MAQLTKNGMIDVEIMFETLMNSTEECVVVVDKDGRVVVLSKAYAEFLNLDRDKVIGKHVTEVIENTRMHIVVSSGFSEIAQKQIVRGKAMIASRFPIVKNGEIIGALGRVLFQNIDQLNSLYEKINDIEKELTLYKKTLIDRHNSAYSFDDIITVNPEMIKLKAMAKRVSKTNSNVLLLGESGTGKELFAHSIHTASNRSKKPFVSINCGAIPIELLESELFGYESGAFTGASKKGKVGLLKVADGGTVFLDEVGEMPLNLQVKLLRFLQEKEITRIGSNTKEKVDVRIISATNSNLSEMMDKGKFRMDIYYRLSVVALRIPPLRERREDIRELSDHLIKKICAKENMHNIEFSKDARCLMQTYDWPGNIRELENVLESAINFVGKNNLITPDKLPDKLLGQAVPTSADSGFSMQQSDLTSAVDAFEKEIISKALFHTNHNKSRTAKMLGISRTSLYEKLKKHGM